MEKRVFKAYLNVAPRDDFFEPTIVSVRAWLDRNGIDYATPNSIEEPFILNIDLNKDLPFTPPVNYQESVSKPAS